MNCQNIKYKGQMLSPIFGAGGGGVWRNEKGVSQNYGAENRVQLRAAFTYFFPDGITLCDTYQNKELTLGA